MSKEQSIVLENQVGVKKHRLKLAVYEEGSKRNHPPWIKARFPSGKIFEEVQSLVTELKLNTVCESASCPNRGECWNERALTIMILGNICTRSCRFCDVPMGKPLPVDPDEPRRVALALEKLSLNHTVITCVNRDDLSDGGALHWAETITQVKKHCPSMTLEVLTGDFKGDLRSLDKVLDAGPDVFAHNLETVPRLSKQVRVQASYDRSYKVLAHARKRGFIVKTGLMLGLGEELGEVIDVLKELSALKCDIVTLGQYLSPSRYHLPVFRYVHPDEFTMLKEKALTLGIPHVEAGPMVRSSYHAYGQAELIQKLRSNDGGDLRV